MLICSARVRRHLRRLVEHGSRMSEHDDNGKQQVSTAPDATAAGTATEDGVRTYRARIMRITDDGCRGLASTELDSAQRQRLVRPLFESERTVLQQGRR